VPFCSKDEDSNTVLSLLFVDRVALEQETAVAVDKMKLKMIGSNSADTGTAQQQEQHYQKLTAEMQQQRQSLQELYQQVLQAAYANTNDPPEPTETSIKFAKRPVSIREFSKGQVLGYGNFSEICVVTHTVTKQVFALKQIPKKQAADLAKPSPHPPNRLAKPMSLYHSR
jgi:hypothetical protein